MRTLLIDNYDSFTFNLCQLLAEVNGEMPLVVRHDAAPWEVLRRLPFDNVVLSPGPGRPERDGDFGVCRDALAEALHEAALPVLGVCLGHQGLCHQLGGTVDYADQVMHGRPSEVVHSGTGILAGIPSPFTVIRYHSLLVTDLPEALRATGHTKDGILMSVEHGERPVFGVQFHPESVGTEHGAALVRNFAEITRRHWAEHERAGGLGDGSVSPELYLVDDVVGAAEGPPRTGNEGATVELRVYCERIDDAPDAERLFEELYGDAQPAFWLDSALECGAGRFSFMGDASGPRDLLFTYAQDEGLVRARSCGPKNHGVAEEHPGTVFDCIDRHVRRTSVLAHDLPFRFVGGFVGYLGYELKAGSAASRAHRSTSPDASFLLSHRFVAVDHETRQAFIVCLDTAADEDRANEWVAETARRVRAVAPEKAPLELPDPRPVPRRMRHDEAAYLERIQRCLDAIRTGESYELCLTNRIEFDVAIDPWTTYRALRSLNPAPYAAWLHFEGLQILSASPERFVSVDATGAIEAKPIKGTRPRGETDEEDRALAADLAGAEKDRAENLIIVDLLRNDIGRTAAVGSVHVPKLFDVESYATVHQLVSTVRGQLRDGASAVQTVRAAFPGGSMTGAPKRRTLEILDELEGGPRGIYSGALGYFSLDGAADFSIVIRTIVVEGSVVSVGVGGAIVDLSTPSEEVAEMLLKAKGSVRALERS